MSPTIRHKYKYFHSAVQRAKYRRQKFHFCRLTYDHVTSNLISLITAKIPENKPVTAVQSNCQGSCFHFGGAV